MALFRLDWFGLKVTQSLRQQTLVKLKAAGDHLLAKTKDNISIDVVRLAGGKVIRSKPGEYPRRDTKRLQQTLRGALDLKALEARVESPMDYALKLEAQGVKGGDRPWLTRTLQEELPTIQAIMDRPIALLGGP